jgi:hypothetical protein
MLPLASDHRKQIKPANLPTDDKIPQEAPLTNKTTGHIVHAP